MCGARNFFSVSLFFSFPFVPWREKSFEEKKFNKSKPFVCPNGDDYSVVYCHAHPQQSQLFFCFYKMFMCTFFLCHVTFALISYFFLLYEFLFIALKSFILHRKMICLHLLFKLLYDDDTVDNFIARAEFLLFSLVLYFILPFWFLICSFFMLISSFQYI